MKFALKVLVLGCLVILSKLAKDDAVALHKPIAKEAEAQPVYTQQAELVPAVTERKASFISVKYEKGSLQFN